jgi:hypothetical protein
LRGYFFKCDGEGGTSVLKKGFAGSKQKTLQKISGCDSVFNFKTPVFTVF